MKENCGERIYAAAMAWFNDDNVPCVITGPSHADCIEQCKQHNVTRAMRHSEWQGFILNDGTMVNRRDALKLAIKHNQLKPDAPECIQLYSEFCNMDINKGK